MPSLPTEAQRADGDDAFRVLLTGFGPSANGTENPSWLAVKPLHNTIMTAKPSSEPVALDGKILMAESHNKPGRKPRPIHMSALQIPMTYEAVLDTVPGLHGRPPRLPETEDQFFPPPPEMGYDFVFHVGAAGRGALRMERVGHKLGYHMKDLSGKLASLVRALPKDFSRVEAENTERERVGVDAVSDGVNGIDHLTHTTRGFGGPAYENFPDEIMTDIDVLRLIGDLKRSGIEDIYTSMDAGHYLSDFVYYCSLAEARRNAKPYEKHRNTQVLCVHCPPVNLPLSTEEVTDAIRRIVNWVCGELQEVDDLNAQLEGSDGGA